MIKKIYIVLEDGHVFEGKSFGAEGEALGELVFTTGMGGYIETLTDPSYYGQIVMQTFPLIGNYGIMEEDFESDRSYVSGYVVREWCELPSNFRTEYDLDTFLKKQGIVGVYGVDTREITRIIREKGVMNAKIVSSVDNIDYDEIKANDYNLNIPRYVDTFEQEEEISLSDIANELTEQDKEIKDVQNELLSQFAELTADDEQAQAEITALMKTLEGLF